MPPAKEIGVQTYWIDGALLIRPEHAGDVASARAAKVNRLVSQKPVERNPSTSAAAVFAAASWRREAGL